MECNISSFLVSLFARMNLSNSKTADKCRDEEQREYGLARVLELRMRGMSNILK